MWTLEEDGTLAHHPVDHDTGPAPVSIDPDEADATAFDRALAATEVTILFKAFSDGRGFSLARRLRDRAGPRLRLVAVGHILPDQARHAFQSGFDALRIDDALIAHHGAEAWRSAMRDAVGPIYTITGSASGIWARRHATAA